MDWWVSVPGAPEGRVRALTMRDFLTSYFVLFPGSHVANEIAKPQVCINSNNSSVGCKKLQPEMEICNRKYKLTSTRVVKKLLK